MLLLIKTDHRKGNGLPRMMMLSHVLPSGRSVLSLLKTEHRKGNGLPVDLLIMYTLWGKGEGLICLASLNGIHRKVIQALLVLYSGGSVDNLYTLFIATSDLHSQ